MVNKTALNTHLSRITYVRDSSCGREAFAKRDDYGNLKHKCVLEEERKKHILVNLSGKKGTIFMHVHTYFESVEKHRVLFKTINLFIPLTS